MTFFIEVADDFTYTSIMEVMISSSLTHHKSSERGITRLEISGSARDYAIFEKIVNEANTRRGTTVARIMEGV
jgi:hypothetical protein